MKQHLHKRARTTARDALPGALYRTRDQSKGDFSVPRLVLLTLTLYDNSLHGLPFTEPGLMAPALLSTAFFFPPRRDIR
jgi:hypothetical protein